MNSHLVKIVIGSNYGDEGKGLMTDYFCNKNKKYGQVLNICSNGGAQRGHTVETLDGKRHVFHHFGSGTFTGAVTYLSNQYIINPIIFCQEYFELAEMGYRPVVYVSPKCRITTPYDIWLNRLKEINRGDKRHGSCGLGIWETIKRNNTEYKFNICDCNAEPNLRNKIQEFLDINKDYFLKQATKNNLEIDNDILNNPNFLSHYIDDFCYMMNHITISDVSEIIQNYPSIVIENAQGLLLDGNIKSVHTTPTQTGICNIFDSLQNIDFSKLAVEACYVTRPYLTRHGAGEFPTECDVNQISHTVDISKNDLTNLPNDFQGKIRYGKINLHKLSERIKSDMQKAYKIYPESVNSWVISSAVTHLNETNGFFCCNDKSYKDDEFLDLIYKSHGRTKESVSTFYNK